MPKIDLEVIPQNNATGYPAPFDAEVRAAGSASWGRCSRLPISGPRMWYSNPAHGHRSGTGMTAKTNWW